MSGTYAAHNPPGEAEPTCRDIGGQSPGARCVAEGGDPGAVTAGQLARGTPIWVDADADEHEVLRLMEEHKIRRLPVMENHRLVGMISEADLATHLDEDEVAEYASAVYSAPPNL